MAPIMIIHGQVCRGDDDDNTENQDKKDDNHDFSWGRDQCGGDDGDDNLNKKWQNIREIMLRMLMMMIRKR